MNSEILFIAHRMPFPPNRGDKIRSHHILKRLARLAPVHVACFADDDADMAEEVELAALAHSYRLVRRAKPLIVAGMQALATHTPVSLAAFHDRALASYVRTTLASGRIGTVFVFSGQMGQFVPPTWDGRLVVDFCDVDSAKFEAYAGLGRGAMSDWINGREARLLRAEEVRLAARADVSLLISAHEAALFRARAAGTDADQADVRVIGNGIDSVTFDPGQVTAEPRVRDAGQPALIFTGQMDYAPNVDAALRVAQRILPLVRKVLPEASFHIVGRAPGEALQALDGQDGVRVWGAVDDVRGWLKGADMALIPLEIARGVQNKVLEAMAMELPVVLTGASATGINGIAGLQYHIAESDGALAEAVIELTQDHRRAAAMGIAARRFVVEQASWATALAPLGEIVLGRGGRSTAVPGGATARTRSQRNAA